MRHPAAQLRQPLLKLSALKFDAPRLGAIACPFLITTCKRSLSSQIETGDFSLEGHWEAQISIPPSLVVSSTPYNTPETHERRMTLVVGLHSVPPAAAARPVLLHALLSNQQQRRPREARSSGKRNGVDRLRRMQQVLMLDDASCSAQLDAAEAATTAAAVHTAQATPVPPAKHALRRLEHLFAQEPRETLAWGHETRRTRTLDAASAAAADAAAAAAGELRRSHGTPASSNASSSSSSSGSSSNAQRVPMMPLHRGTSGPAQGELASLWQQRRRQRLRWQHACSGHGPRPVAGTAGENSAPCSAAGVGARGGYLQLLSAEREAILARRVREGQRLRVAAAVLWAQLRRRPMPQELAAAAGYGGGGSASLARLRLCADRAREAEAALLAANRGLVAAVARHWAGRGLTLEVRLSCKAGRCRCCCPAPTAAPPCTDRTIVVPTFSVLPPTRHPPPPPPFSHAHTPAPNNEGPDGCG